MKHEWRKKEKAVYLPKTTPVLINIPGYKFITIEGEGNPNSHFFSECISVLYLLAYAIKMNLKKLDIKPDGYSDYTIYPLEGIWDINQEAKNVFDGKICKDDLVYKLMIRLPDFVSMDFFCEMLEVTKSNKRNELLNKVNFELITDGLCVQMMHVGSYDDEPRSFKLMEQYADSINMMRPSNNHREIYLSDFRKVHPEKLKTTLRFSVAKKHNKD